MVRIQILFRPYRPKPSLPKALSEVKPHPSPILGFNKTTIISVGLLTISEILSLSPTETNGIIDTCVNLIRKM